MLDRVRDQVANRLCQPEPIPPNARRLVCGGELKLHTAFLGSGAPRLD
jgi:hypothetical protein